MYMASPTLHYTKSQNSGNIPRPLNQWESELLEQHVHFTDGPFTLTAQFEHNTTPRQAATDGSIANCQGTFRWIIFTSNET